MIRHQKDALNLMLSEFVIAAEEDCILGFGILGKDRDDTSCLMVKENGRRHKIGAFIVRHLLEYAPMKTICVASGKFGNFRKLDYSKKNRITKATERIRAAWRRE